MSTILAALLPVASLILLGLLLRRLRFLDDRGWAGAERLVYFVLFPALLFLELSRASLAEVPVGAIVAVLLASLLAMSSLAAVLRRPLAIPGPAYTSLLQGLVRWNSYVAVALGPLLFGRQGTAVMALAVAVLVPLANVLSVAALARHGGKSAGGWRGFARALVTNPLILACVAGQLWAQTGLGLPGLLADTLTILARATLALGLLTVGAGLRAFSLRASSPVLAAALAGKLVLNPLLALALGLWLGLEGPTLGACILICGVPTASSSYILARIAGGDAELMAAIITPQTLAAMVTLPMLLLLAAP